MEHFPQNFHRQNYTTTTPRSRICGLRKNIYNIVNENSSKLESGLSIEFENNLISCDIQTIVAELRERGFKASCNFNIYKGKHIINIS